MTWFTFNLIQNPPMLAGTDPAQNLTGSNGNPKKFCVINCNHPQITAVKSLFIMKYLFKGLFYLRGY